MKRIKRAFWISVSLAVLGALDLLPIMGIGRIIDLQEKRRSSNLIGAVFWGCLILSQIFFWYADKKRRRWLQKRSLPADQGAVGAFAFFQNRCAIVCDVMMIISGASVLAAYLSGTNSALIVITSVALLLLTVQLHCFFNGRNFRFINKYGKRRDGNESKKDI
ncbi:MAG: hypothetical protein IJ071_09670 [Ruminococcus sp.]|nr:hypothetical protein [Ruminococcus sp.]